MNTFTIYTKGRKAGTVRSKGSSVDVRRKLLEACHDPLTLVWRNAKTHAATTHAKAKADLFLD